MKVRALFIAILMLIAAPGAFYPVPAYADPANPEEQNVYSNEAFVRLVKKYLSDDGDKIDYAAWKDSPEESGRMNNWTRLAGYQMVVGLQQFSFNMPMPTNCRLRMEHLTASLPNVHSAFSTDSRLSWQK